MMKRYNRMAHRIAVYNLEHCGRRYQITYNSGSHVYAAWGVYRIDEQEPVYIGSVPYSEDARNLARLDAETFANRSTDQ